MADVAPQHEVQDNQGSSVAYSGTATTTVQSVPAAAGNSISGVGIFNDGSVDLSVSFDGGATFLSLGKKSFFSWDAKGSITQLEVKTLSATADFQILINHEDN